MAGKIRAITFDVGHTLIEPRGSVGHTYAEIAAQHGYPGLPPAELDRRFSAAFAALNWVANTREQWAQIVDATFAGLISELPSKTFFPELFDRFGERSAWRMYEDVVPALDQLARANVRLGVISNWDHRLGPLLAAFELASRFEVTVISCEVGYSKPAREIFALAAQQLQLAPEEILHVGDSWEMDVQGARAARFQSVQISRNQPAVTDRIASLEELSELVAANERAG